MPATEIKIQDAIIKIPKSSEKYPSVLLFGLPKTGTTLLANVFKIACSQLEQGHVPLHDQLFKQGLGGASDEILIPLNEVFSAQGYAYGTFRKYYNFITPAVLNKLNKIVIVRDPKDMLVSDYFSMAYSHPMPGGKAKSHFIKLRDSLQEADINEAVRRRLPNFIERIQTFRNVFPTSNLKVYQYEDIIFEKQQWIKDMMDFCEWPMTDRHIAKILESVDIFPEKEDKSNHIRQVAPGNYKKYLSEETIAYIDQYLDLFLLK